MGGGEGQTVPHHKRLAMNENNNLTYSTNYSKPKRPTWKSMHACEKMNESKDLPVSEELNKFSLLLKGSES